MHYWPTPLHRQRPRLILSERILGCFPRLASGVAIGSDFMGRYERVAENFLGMLPAPSFSCGVYEMASRLTKLSRLVCQHGVPGLHAIEVGLRWLTF